MISFLFFGYRQVKMCFVCNMAEVHNEKVKLSSKTTPNYYSPLQVINLRNVYLELRI